MYGGGLAVDAAPFYHCAYPSPLCFTGYCLLPLQDDGYAGTLKNKREPNTAGELGRTTHPLVPMQVGGQGGHC